MPPQYAFRAPRTKRIDRTARAMESDIQPFDWHRLLLGMQPPSYLFEVALRCLLLFLVLLAVMRLLGKRGQANLSPMQQILMIALGSAAGDTLFYPSVSLSVAVVVLIGVTLLTMGLEWTSEHVRMVRRYLDSRPRVLVRDGEVDVKALHKERTERNELYAKLRVAGARSLSQVDCAILEVTGEISVFLNDRKPSDQDLLQDVLDQDAGHSQGKDDGG